MLWSGSVCHAKVCHAMYKLKEKLQSSQTDPVIQALAGVGAATLLLLLISFVSGMKLGPGEDTGFLALLTSTFGGEGATPWGQDAELSGPGLPNFILPLFWGGLLLTVLYAVVSPQYRKSLISAVLIVILVTYALLRLQDRQNERELESEGMQQRGGLMEFGTREELPPVPPEMPSEYGNWVGVAAGACAVPLAGWGLYTLWTRYGRREEEAAAQIVSHAEEALSALDAGENVAGTIQRCYATMLHTFERSQRVRRPRGMTPREFEAQLQAVGLHSQYVNELSQLFMRTRFGEKPASTGDREKARDCLQNIVTNLNGIVRNPR